jgi:hypothetical protein
MFAAPKLNDVVPASIFEQGCVDWPNASADPDANCPFAVKPPLPDIPVVALKNRTLAFVSGDVGSSEHAAADSTAARTTMDETFLMQSSSNLQG